MGKSDQKRIGKQAEANSAEDQGNARTAFSGVSTGIGDYGNFLDQTYGPNGTFLKNSSVMANDVSQASEKGFEDTAARDATRTGYNTANVPAVEAEAARQSARDMTGFNAKQQQTATEALNRGKASIPQMWEGAYGQSVNAADAGLNTAQKAENQPPWWQTALNYAAEGGKDYAATGCWIAEALWSPTDIRVFILRAWLNDAFTKTPVGSMVMWLYRTFGRSIAAVARRSRLLRSVLRPLFMRALNQALSEVN